MALRQTDDCKSRKYHGGLVRAFGKTQGQPRIFADERGLIGFYSLASMCSITLPREKPHCGFCLKADPRYPRKAAVQEGVESFSPAGSYIPLVWSPPPSVRWSRWKPKRPKSRVGCDAVTLTCSTF